MNFPIRAVLFDFDLTLADSSGAIIECVQHAFAEMQLLKPKAEDVRRSIGLPLPETYTFLGGSDEPAERALFAKLFVQRADEVMVMQTEFYAGVRELFEGLKSNGLKIGIVSTKFRYRIEAILKKGGFEAYIDLIIGSEDVKSHKPDPEGIVKALRELSVQSAETLYVGDHPMDAETATRAGVQFLGVLSGTTDADAWRVLGQASIREPLTEIVGLVVN